MSMIKFIITVRMGMKNNNNNNSPSGSHTMALNGGPRDGVLSHPHSNDRFVFDILRALLLYRRKMGTYVRINA